MAPSNRLDSPDSPSHETVQPAPRAAINRNGDTHNDYGFPYITSPEPVPSHPANQNIPWNIPFYGGNDAATPRVSQIPIDSVSGDRRLASDLTLNDNAANPYTLSSYQHPYDILPPPNAYSDFEGLARSSQRPSVSFVQNPSVREYVPENEYDEKEEREAKRRGIPSNVIDLYALERGKASSSQSSSSSGGQFTRRRPNVRRMDSTNSAGSDILDPDDPRITGTKAQYLEDPAEVQKNALRNMDYRSRRKHLMRVKIEYNITSMANRQEFLIRLARALMTFGAPSHRIESQLVAAARILEVEAEFIHLPGIVICSFGDQELGCSETHFVKCGGRLSLGALHKVHLIYRSVVHDEISAKTATTHLEELMEAPPLYSIPFRCFLSFTLSLLICPLAFGGSFLDMWVAGAGAFVLAVLQLCATKSALYANVFEITVAIFVSFTARGLSSIKSQIFCYTAISSAGIIGILPGYLILSSSLELASKNIVCGSVKMVYALIYTLFLGFGLQIGSDFFLLFDRATRRRLDALASNLQASVALTGNWVADNDTHNSSIPLVGTWTFTHTVSMSELDIIDSCYRPKSFPWYLQPFPFWTSFIIVPVFSLLSSLANLQPFKSKQLPVMVIISCCSYASNKVANHYIFNRSDVVSAIGAFTVGILGNVYSRKMGGTAFTSMVTGVLFLVPSGLSSAGGITANGNGIDIGGAMIAVTIGITVGLFMSQALVYMFGTRKNAAVFSF